MTDTLRAIVRAHDDRLPARGADVLELVHLCALARAQARRLATHGSDGDTGELERIVRAIELLGGAAPALGAELRSVVVATLDTVSALLRAVGAPGVVASSAASLVPPLAPRARAAPASACLALVSGRAVAIDAAGGAGDEIELASSRPVSAARAGSAMVTAHADGTLVATQTSRATLERAAVVRAPGRAWVAVAPVRRAGERCIAAIDETGAVELRSPDLADVIDRFQLDAGVPVDMVGEGEALCIAFTRGPVRRVRPVAPDRVEAFAATKELDGIRSMAGAQGAIVALTAGGRVLLSDAHDPDEAPWACEPAGRRAVCAAWLDDAHVMAADETGALWRVHTATRELANLRASLSCGPTALARAGDLLVAAHADASVELLSLDGARPPATLVLSSPVAAVAR